MVFIPGNHDEFARGFAGHRFAGIEVMTESVHTTADGRRLWVIRGDYFDAVVQCAAKTVNGQACGVGASSSANVPRAAWGRSSSLMSLRYSPQPHKLIGSWYFFEINEHAHCSQVHVDAVLGAAASRRSSCHRQYGGQPRSQVPRPRDPKRIFTTCHASVTRLSRRCHHTVIKYINT